MDRNRIGARKSDKRGKSRDGDSIIDYVDFEINGNGFNEAIFKEVKLRIDGPITDDAHVMLIYNDSPPPGKEGGKLRSGILRLWISQSGEARDPKSLKDGGGAGSR